MNNVPTGAPQESDPVIDLDAVTLAEARRLLLLPTAEFSRARDEHLRTLSRKQAILIGDCWEQLVTKPKFRDPRWQGILEQLEA